MVEEESGVEKVKGASWNLLSNEKQPLVYLQGQLNAQGRINEVLGPFALSDIQELDNFLFLREHLAPYCRGYITFS